MFILYIKIKRFNFAQAICCIDFIKPVIVITHHLHPRQHVHFCWTRRSPRNINGRKPPSRGSLDKKLTCDKETPASIFKESTGNEAF